MEFLQQNYLDNTLQDWLTAVVVGLTSMLAFRLVQALVSKRLRRLAVRTQTRWDDHILEMLDGTRMLFWFVTGAWLGSLWLELPERAIAVAQSAFIIALLVQAGLWGKRLVGAVLGDYRKRQLDENPAGVTSLGIINFAAQVLLWSVVVLLILDNLGINVTALVAGLGIGGVAVALALQTILSDLFASLSIVLDKPFVVGDFLMVGDFLGSVEKIGLKTTRLRSLSGEQLVFSNNDLLSSRVRNFGRMQERRVVFKLGVTYQTPRERLQEIPGMIRDAIESQGNTRFDRSHFSAYGDFSLVFESVYYVLSADYNEYMDIQQSIYLKIHEAFEKASIEFAYPTQTLYVARGEAA